MWKILEKSELYLYKAYYLLFLYLYNKGERELRTVNPVLPKLQVGFFFFLKHCKSMLHEFDWSEWHIFCNGIYPIFAMEYILLISLNENTVLVLYQKAGNQC